MQKLDKQFIKKVRRQDRLATRAITLGGLLVIASVIAILVLIVRVTLPLFQPASAKITHRLQVGSALAPVLAVGMDNTQEVGFTLNDTGMFSFYDLASGKTFSTLPASTRTAKVLSIEDTKNNIFALLWEDNSVSVSRVDFRSLYAANGQRTIQPEISQLGEYPARTYPAQVKSVAIRVHEGRLTEVALLADNRFQIDQEVVTTDLLDNETKENFSFLIAEEMPGKITAFTVDEKGATLFAGTDTGSLLRWDLRENATATRTDNVVAVPDNKAVTALAMVFGDISVAVGDAEGGLVTWSQIWTGTGKDRTQRLRKTHTLTGHQSPVERIIPSRRSKSLVSVGADGKTHFDHMTSENHLLDLAPPMLMVGISGQGNGLIGLGPDNSLTVWQIDAPHPEISLKTLFGKVWYESYDKPEYVWQSSSGSDDFEAKFSLVPLLFGTIKGTLYAMIFAVPLAIFGAVYTSQFSTATFKKTVKPVVEIMASIPSVVIGFLIALWLAPIVEKAILSVILTVILLPLIFVGIMAALRPFYKTPTLQNFCNGYEFLMLAPVILLATALAMGIAPTVEPLLFAGNFKQWLYNDLGMRYDQRNCIIIAFGLGIAVIPIIFSITEDAISNIPPSLTAASLALGASRWQTIWRVVLPSASPGIFAAIMIGFGRAVGETMIVLMATGNTPILDWSIFNGMRTLSANIAVEIPEAPMGGTLYRVLFLCASMLFALTFLVNTGAELIRERLRKKYGRY
ncbi:ABC transporter permease subunit [Thiovibrio frasassiensis]|uniref:ABC transporter permease subunit n=1 Tax=Thiovibrio frasassiensis TaxID=2984131 RepID=A0A9X4MJX6_9BACT|nr:ABC transporter permease subunit [Thiovibrio frasassiensis]MDG4476194.1 ABC transporter permease subunit [Thiovibrio frasassiensis]